jgi:hypothetical protein
MEQRKQGSLMVLPWPCAEENSRGLSIAWKVHRFSQAMVIEGTCFGMLIAGAAWMERWSWSDHLGP